MEDIEDIKNTNDYLDNTFTDLGSEKKYGGSDLKIALK